MASSAPAANIDAAMDAVRIAPLFEALVSADEVGVGKPDPAVFLAAADRVGVPPARCVVVEDAPAGLWARDGQACAAWACSRPTTPSWWPTWSCPPWNRCRAAAFEELLGDG